MGEWVYRDKNNHKCAKPPGGYDVKSGDIWRCDCGKLWRVTNIVQKGDQRDYYWDISVTEHTESIPSQKTGYNSDRSGIYAPGSK